MKNRAALIIGFVVVVLALGYTVTRTSGPGNASLPSPSHFVVEGRAFALSYLATTESEREAGLMNKTITNSTTMLFIFPQPGYYAFWMYHTDSGLDIIWMSVDGDSGRVVYLVRDAPSCYDANQCASYTPTARANYVLEAKAGFAEANDIGVGTSVTFG